MNMLTRVLSAVILLMSTGYVMAAKIYIEYTGTVSSVGWVIANGGIDVGDTFTGVFSYDTLAEDSNGNSDVGQYDGGFFSLYFDSGFHVSSFDPVVQMLNDQQVGPATLPGDSMWVFANSSIMGDTLYGRDVLGFSFGFRRENVDGHLWQDDFLPDVDDWAAISLEDLNASSWHWMRFEHYVGESFTDTTIRWDINDFTVNVPEPDTAALFALSLFGLFFSTRNRFKHKNKQ